MSQCSFQEANPLQEQSQQEHEHFEDFKIKVQIPQFSDLDLHGLQHFSSPVTYNTCHLHG